MDDDKEKSRGNHGFIYFIASFKSFTKASISNPCARAPCSRFSYLAAIQPKQCIPYLWKTATVSG